MTRRLFITTSIATLFALGVTGCGKKARLRTPTDERIRQERANREEQAKDYSDKRYEDRQKANDPESDTDTDQVEKDREN